MTGALRRADLAGPWPGDLTRYDRNPVLSQVERAALDTLVHQRIDARKDRLTPSGRTVLARLVQPLADALALTGTHAPGTTIRLLLLEMRRRESAFWAWSDAQWAESIGQDRRSFTQRHRNVRAAVRPHVMVVAYLLGGFRRLGGIGDYYRFALASRVFGDEIMSAALQRVGDALHALGYAATLPGKKWHNLLSEALLINGSPIVDEITDAVLQQVRANNPTPPAARGSIALSRALHSLGIVPRPLAPVRMGPRRHDHYAPGSQIAEAWVRWIDRWHATSASSERTRDNIYTLLIKTGRWLAQRHPDVVSPEQWTRELAAEFVAAVDRMTVGEYLHPNSCHIPPQKRGKPLMNNSKVAHIAAVRVLLRDCQDWGWIPRRFDPIRSMPFTRAMLSQRKPSPRVIADDVWAKLLWAGLNLTAGDLPVCLCHAGPTMRSKPSWYPLTMVRAVVIVWLFAGLRRDEVRRLRVGCVRWQREDRKETCGGEALAGDGVCLLDVPVNKTGSAFTKPVDRYVGEAIVAWERERPLQPAVLDQKTGSLEHLLFMYRGKPIGTIYLNETIIPMLCRKAGVPALDARGRLTSHRARSTIASQLFNAKEPMSLFELQAWLGHQSVSSTQYYVKITPTKLAQSYRDAGYFERNRRLVHVLIDQDAIRTAAAGGAPWKYYDLGYGYCTYDFFDQCPHRMACAKCSFYLPKDSCKAQSLEAKGHLQRMLQEIPLNDGERAAVEDGIAAMDKLCTALMDIRTPAGTTPRELAAQAKSEPLPGSAR